MSRPTDAWMPLYIADWEAGTGHLSCEQDGAYGRLVRWYWRNGPLPDDDRLLAQITGLSAHKWRVSGPVLRKFFHKRSSNFSAPFDEKLYHNRIERELAEWIEKKRIYVERAAAGGRAKGAKSRTKAVLKGCTSPSSGREDDPIDQSSPSSAASAPLPAEWQAQTPLTPQQKAYLDERGIAYD